MRRAILATFLLTSASCGSAPHPTRPLPPAPPPTAPAPRAPLATPSPKTSPAPRITALSRSGSRCGLDEAGALWCWNNMRFERSEDGPTSGAKAFADGGTHGCMLDAASVVACWGNNDRGALGDGTTTYRERPRPVVGLGSAVEVLAADGRSCARTAAGDLHCWGNSSWGALGDGTLVDDGVARPQTKAGSPILRGVTAAAMGSSHTCAAFADGSVSCWGTCLSGQCGYVPVHPPTPRPKKVEHAKGVVAIVAAEGVTCAIDRESRVRCWGRLGDRTRVMPRSAAMPFPREYPLPAGEVAVELAVGGPFACARARSGKVFCWGDNEFGMLGDGTTTTRDVAAPIRLAEPAVQIAAVHDEACALVAGGRVFCWGRRRGEGNDDALSPAPVAAP